MQLFFFYQGLRHCVKFKSTKVCNIIWKKEIFNRLKLIIIRKFKNIKHENIKKNHPILGAKSKTDEDDKNEKGDSDGNHVLKKKPSVKSC